VGFIHYIIHEDVIGGAPNSFITAFYVQGRFRGRGIGSALLREAVTESAEHGVVNVETSTIHSRAKSFYEKHHFRQVQGDIPETFLDLDVVKFLKVQ
jgi:GNAT superfamily N-acetyltransferase